MPPPPAKDSQLGMVAMAATAAAVAGSLSYFITREIIKSRESTERLIAFEQSRAQKELTSKRNLKQGLPSGIKIPNLQIRDVYLWEVEHLGHRFDSEDTCKGIENKMHGVKSSTPIPKSPTFVTKKLGDADGEGKACKQDSTVGEREDDTDTTAYNKLIGIHECIIADLVRKPDDNQTTHAYVRAGPRRELHFDPKTVNAAIVTCGGLCPGLNNVVREIVNSLYYLYGIEGKVYGIRGGFKGFHEDNDLAPLNLTPQVVSQIHQQGGTVLGSSRGGFDLEKIIGFLKAKKVNQLYVIGGDGTHRGAFLIHEGCMSKVS
jgi:hypothetical protein